MILEVCLQRRATSVYPKACLKNTCGVQRTQARVIKGKM